MHILDAFHSSILSLCMYWNSLCILNEKNREYLHKLDLSINLLNTFYQ